ncbi:hypothetical protein EYF80_054246 [Liparis tanakae]|uniref:Uncharacterized protein n=1 Tax=Liparis tanakae TaxID=230148 RepID=A0A4Z2F376_9TELE|nr:hypothetical protein EYF80_054246 [Liparis tanakae]
MPLRIAADLQEGARSRSHLNKHTSEFPGISRKSSQSAGRGVAARHTAHMPPCGLSSTQLRSTHAFFPPLMIPARVPD